MQQELENHLATHPGLRFIDLLHDLNGVDRGKRVDLASARDMLANGLLLPGSMFALDVPGRTVQATGLGFDEGDADHPCLPVPGSLVEVPWLDHGVAQAQLTMHERNGQPFSCDADMAGSGLHLHASMGDAAGRNVFAADDPLGSTQMRHAAAGLLGTMADGMAIFAPLSNSWRRFRSEAYVPLTADWSVNNRGAALRVPVSDAANRRLEHRVAGADANPYLVMSWVLGGVLKGLAEQRAQRAPLEGNPYDGAGVHGEDLPHYWPTALDQFTTSVFARELLGPELHRLYGIVKRHELDEFSQQVTAGEIATLLPAL